MKTVTFPGLGLEFNLPTVAVSIGPIRIHWYAVIITAGLMLALWYITKRAPEFGVDPDRVVDFALVCTITGIIGARLYFVAFRWEYFSQNPGEIIKTWTGGMAIYGGIIGGVIGGVVLAGILKLRKLPIADMAMGGLILAQGIGRWGNFVNVEAFGSNTALPWGMSGPEVVRYLSYRQNTLAAQGVYVDPYAPVHPTFFYEFLWCMIGFGLIAYFTGKRRFDGEITLLYTGWYGAGRYVIEGLRTDSLMWGSVRVSQALAAVCVVASIGIWLYVRGKIKGNSDPDYLRPYAQTDQYPIDRAAWEAAKAAAYGTKSEAVEGSARDSESAFEPEVPPEDASPAFDGGAEFHDTTDDTTPDQLEEEETTDGDNH